MIRHIYIHYPFCQKKCGYCSFYSVIFEKSLVQKYLYKLHLEIDDYIKKYDIIPETIYFGGGTPSLLKANEIDKILQRFDLSQVKEITLEVNPATITINDLRAFRDIGINRLSLGVQSMDDSELEILGRSHRVKDVMSLYEAGLNDIFDNVSIDLIYGIPPPTFRDGGGGRGRTNKCPRHEGRTIQAVTSVGKALVRSVKNDFDDRKRNGQVRCIQRKSEISATEHSGLVRSLRKNIPPYPRSPLYPPLRRGARQKCIPHIPASHISIYCLTLEENVPLYKMKDRLPDDEKLSEMYFHLCDVLQKNGFEQYELSSFCRDGKVSLHNLCYWSSKNYLGLGAGASGYIENFRYQNHELDSYLSDVNEHNFIKEIINLTSDDIEKEFIITGFRKTKGISIKEFNEKFGCDFREKYKNSIKKMLKMGLIEVNNIDDMLPHPTFIGGDYIRIKKESYFVAYEVLCEFI